MLLRASILALTAMAAVPAAAQSASEKERVLEVLEQLKAGKDVGVPFRQTSQRAREELTPDLDMARKSARECTLGRYAMTNTVTSKPGLSEIALNMDCGSISNRYGMLFAFQDGVLEGIELRPGGILFRPAPPPARPEPDHSKPTKAMQGFLDEVASGKKTAAQARIARIESLSGSYEFMLNLTPAQLVDRLAACKLGEYSSKGSAVLRVESTVWNCDDGETYYVSFMDERDPDNPYLNVVDIQDAAIKAKYEERPPTRPAPMLSAIPRRAMTPAEIEAEEARKAFERDKQMVASDLFGQAVVSGDLATLKGIVSDRTRVIYQTRDPYFKTDIVSKQGMGAQALKEVIAQAKSELGKPSSVNCAKDEGGYSPHTCRWTMQRQDRSMFAFLTFSGETLSAVQFYYAKREEVLQMRQRAIEAGKIDG